MAVQIVFEYQMINSDSTNGSGSILTHERIMNLTEEKKIEKVLHLATKYVIKETQYPSSLIGIKNIQIKIVEEELPRTGLKFRAYDKKMGLSFPFNIGDSPKWGKNKEIKSNWAQTTIIEQYTGFKDTNGNEIFEGDIVKVYYRNGWVKCEVVRHNGMLIYLVLDGSSYFIDLDSSYEEYIFLHSYNSEDYEVNVEGRANTP